MESNAKPLDSLLLAAPINSRNGHIGAPNLCMVAAVAYPDLRPVFARTVDLVLCGEQLRRGYSWPTRHLESAPAFARAGGPRRQVQRVRTELERDGVTPGYIRAAK